ncbi:glycosyl transferase [Aureococcus anophagefferens]|nr:glycosyl transferase [Aureococcus anophagefferens]
MATYERRQGKWTTQECDYAMLLIEHFTSGSLPGLLGGESLRSTLSECLMCTPMRVTKKLSSTHAIGKCCFKKKGDLGPGDRAAPTPRLAFASRKRSRDLDGDDGEPGWLESLAGGSWLAEPEVETPAALPGLPRAHEESGAVETSVLAHVTDEGRTAVRIVVADRPGLLGEMSRFFQRKNLSVVGCRCETLPGSVAHDEFDVVDTHSRRPVVDAEDLELLEEAVLECLAASERHFSGATTLNVSLPDRPGLLKQITETLGSLRLSIVGAKISTVARGRDSPEDAGLPKTAVDTFDVVDAETGGPVLDPNRLREIERRLALDLETDESASGASSLGSNSPRLEIFADGSPPRSRSISAENSVSRHSDEGVNSCASSELAFAAPERMDLAAPEIPAAY